MLWVCGAAADVRESTDPANYALGARSIGMGGTVAAIGDDANALQANPAVLAATPKFQFGVSSYTLLNEYNFLNIVSIIPTPWGHFGLTYLSYGVTDIPATDLDTVNANPSAEPRIYQSGSYDFNEQVLGLSYGMAGPREMALFRNIDLGVTAKLAQSFLDSETLTGFGLDAGLRFAAVFPMLGEFTFGLGIQNLLPPTFLAVPDPESGEEAGSGSAYKMNLRLGVAKSFTLFSQQFVAAGDFDNNGLHAGLEYIAHNSLRFRAGLDDFKPTFGLGYRLFSMSGFDGNPYTMSLDYAYKTVDDTLGNTHYISVTMRGISKTRTPTIETSFVSDKITANAVALSGTAEAEANITLYVNKSLRKTAQTGANGIWNAESVFLDDGKNEIYAVAQYEQYVESDPSALLVVYADQITPSVTTELTSDGTVLFIRAQVNKTVNAVASRLPDNTRIVLSRSTTTPNEWTGSWQITPEYTNTYVTLQTMAIDELGGRSEVVEDVYSTRFVSSPRDKSVTVENTIYVRGTARRGTASIVSGRHSVVPDPETGAYTLPVELVNEGKNVLEIVMIDEDGLAVTASLRVLKVREADDLRGYSAQKNQVTALLTLGVLDSDATDRTKFRPADYFTRAEFAKALAVLKDLPLTAPTEDIALDVQGVYAPYIGAVLEAGYMSMLAEGFAPESFITRKDAVIAITLMDELDTSGFGARQIFTDVPAYMPYAPQVAAAANAGIIAPAENFYPDRELSRAEAAAMLGASRTAKAKTDELYDWKKGYGAQFEENALSGLPAEDRAALTDLYVSGRMISFDADATENLLVIAPQDQDIYDRAQIEVKGLVKDDTQVTINGVVVPAQNGAFLARLTLNEGRNIVRVEGGGEARQLRVLYLRNFIDKPDTLDNLKYNVARRYVAFERFSGNNPITRGEIQIILLGLKEQTGDTSSTENISFEDAVRLLNEWDGKAADSTALLGDLTDPGRPLNREEFILLLANTDTYRGILDSYSGFDSYEQNDAPVPENIEDRSELIIQAETLSRGSDKKKITEQDFQTFLRRYDRQRLNNADSITRSGDSIAADGRTRLLIASPQNNFRTTESSILLRGYSGGVDDVRVNGRRIEAAADSSFELNINLEPGRNILTVENGVDTVRLIGLRLITYSDIQNLQERSLIEYLATVGYFKESTEFFPDKNITREEAAALLVRMLNVAPPQVFQEVFRDVPANRWSAPSIRLLVDRGVIKDQNTFRPEEDITQREAYDWFRQLSRSELTINAPAVLKRRNFVRWLFADERVRAEIDRLNR
jgi:hypothetical protein